VESDQSGPEEHIGCIDSTVHQQGHLQTTSRASKIPAAGFRCLHPETMQSLAPHLQDPAHFNHAAASAGSVLEGFRNSASNERLNSDPSTHQRSSGGRSSGFVCRRRRQQVTISLQTTAHELPDTMLTERVWNRYCLICLSAPSIDQSE